MIIRHIRLSTLLFIVFISCRGTEKNPEPVSGGILEPLINTVKSQEDSTKTVSIIEDTIPLVNPGANYNILTVFNRNLDLVPSDDQVLLSIPLDDDKAPIELMIATANTIQNKYDIVWQQSLNTRTLTGINLEANDLTGNGREDIVVVGFDTNGRHVTEVFAVPKDGKITDFRKVFSLNVEGNIDIVTRDRSADYFSGIKSGASYPIIVQRHDPASGNNLDLIETEWNWDSKQFTYIQGESRLVKAETILEARIEKLYASNVLEYENYLQGAWYRESGEGAFEDILFFNPETREVIFFDGSILEVYIWGTSHRTTAKRLYFKINNSLVQSLADTIYVSVDTWDSIDLAHSSMDWNGSYRRFNTSFQSILEDKLSLKSLLSSQSFSGVWKSHGEQKIIFDLPRIEWITNETKRIGTASIFTIRDTMVLQVQFLQDNGAIEETKNWIAEYSQDQNSTVMIRSLTLSPAILHSDGARVIGTDFLRFEQIEEVLSPN